MFGEGAAMVLGSSAGALTLRALMARVQDPAQTKDAIA